MNNKGHMSVEALISVTLFILVMVFLNQMLMIFSIEDAMSQKTFDSVYRLENYNYLYEKVGILDFELEPIQGNNSEVVNFINEGIQLLDQSSKEAFLKMILTSLLDDQIIIETFDVTDNTLTSQLSYSRSYLFSFTHTYTIDIKKRMWLFGDDHEIYPNKTLYDVVDKQHEDEKELVVFKTKTGEKYHLKGCFYLVRSTTDHNKIVSLSMYKAKYIYHLKACKRCYE